MEIKRQMIKTGLVWAFLLVLLTVLNPSSLPVVLLIVPFVVIFGALYSLGRLLSLVWARYGGVAAKTVVPSRRLSLVVSGFIVLFLVLQSLGQLTFKDVLTLSLLFVLGYFYTIRVRSQRR
jgi:hypothetical protein